MLSIVDIKKELGENIFLYPITVTSIKSNSIDLHLSPFAWSLKTKKPLLDRKIHYDNQHNIIEEGYIIIDPNDSALMYTKESIYLTNKIAGNFHSKVTLVARGLGHIGTTLDAQYVGNLLVTIHNHSDTAVRLSVGQEIITLQLFYLDTPSYKEYSDDNDPGHPRMLNGYDPESYEEYINWRDYPTHTWTKKALDLQHKMRESEEYKLCKREFKIECEKLSKELQAQLAEEKAKELEIKRKNEEIKRKKDFKHRLVVSIACLVGLGVLAVLFAIPAYFIDVGKISTALAKICETCIFPFFTAVLGVIFLTYLKPFKSSDDK